jgi:hypothetical protein
MVARPVRGFGQPPRLISSRTGCGIKEYSGDDPLNSNGFLVLSNGWSGFVVLADTTTEVFCNNESTDLGALRVKRIVMSQNKVRGCP